MQLIRRYLLNNRIVLTANLAGQVTRYRSVYQRNINVYRNIDNVLQFEVKNADEKAVSILNTYTPKFKMWDENNTLVAEKDGTIIETSTPSKVGQFTITLTENDLLNLKQQYMSYSVYLYHTNDAKNVLTYPNSHFGSQGTIYLNTSNFPGPKVSHEVKTFIQDTADNTIYNSETITADPASGTSGTVRQQSQRRLAGRERCSCGAVVVLRIGCLSEKTLSHWLILKHM